MKKIVIGASALLITFVFATLLRNRTPNMGTEAEGGEMPNSSARDRIATIAKAPPSIAERARPRVEAPSTAEGETTYSNTAADDQTSADRALAALREQAPDAPGPVRLLNLKV